MLSGIEIFNFLVSDHLKEGKTFQVSQAFVFPILPIKRRIPITSCKSIKMPKPLLSLYPKLFSISCAEMYR